MTRRPEPTEFVYLMYCAGLIKIGYSKRPVERHRAVNLSMPFEVSLLFILPGDRVRERELHDRFAAERKSGEWFELSDRLRAFIGEQLAATVGGADRLARAETAHLATLTSAAS
jgi:hypothetical protein